MREFATENKMTNEIGSCPTAEELASYIDGTLGKEEAQRVAEHLADCESCYELYSEVLRFQLEPSSEDEPNVDVVLFPIGSRESAVRWLPLAAAAILALGFSVAFFLYPLALFPQMKVAELVEPVEDVPGIEKNLWQYSIYRGNEGSGFELRRPSFQVGALLVDYSLALRAEKLSDASELLRMIGRTVRDTDVTPDEGNRLLKEANQLKAEQDLTQAIARFEKLETTLSSEEESPLDPAYLSFGKWTEAGRLAAVTQRAAFFERRANHRFLKALLRQKDVEPTDRALDHLREIQRVWKTRNFTSAEFQSLEQNFQGILAVYDFQGNGPEGSMPVPMPSVPAPVPAEPAPRMILTSL